MPRRALLLLTALVLALHWLVLVGLPLGATGEGQPRRMAFHTRMVEPPPPPPEAAPAPPPPPPAAPRPRPVRKPKPPPPPAPEPAPVPAPEEAAAPADPTPVSPTETAEDVPAAEAPPPEPPAPAASAEPPPAPPQAAASTPAAAPAESAGVDIQPPGATGAAPSSEPPPVRLPPSTRLSFDVRGEVKKFHYNASAELVWRQDGARYEAQGLQPERFGDKARSEQAAHFNFDTHEVIFSANTPRATIGEGAQDRLSVFIQLGAMLAAAPDRYPTGTRITLTTVGARYADRWTFTVEGPETLELPAGPTPALKLQRLPRHDRDQKAELWLGSQLGYLPVRIRLTQGNGDFAELSLSGHEAP
jgi:hypothetical protein